MTWLKSAAAAWQRILQLPYLGRSSFLLTLTLLLLAVTQDWHRTHPDEEVDEAIELAQKSNQDVPYAIRRLARVVPYLNLWVTLGAGVLVLVIWRRWNEPRKLLLPLSIAAISLTAWALAGELVDYIVHAQMTEFGEPPVALAFIFKQVLMASALLSMPLALLYYVRCGILEQYTLRGFVQPLVFCFLSFCSLWIIADLLDNLKDFQEAKSKLRDVLGFYASLLPYIYVTVIPVALLLATLYSLTRMSRANELISMLSTGRSLAEVLRPIFLCTAYAAFLGSVANYYWAPRAEGNRKAVIRALTARQADSILADSIMFRNELTRRTWYVSTFPFSLRGGRERMQGVRMTEDAPDGQPARTILAPSASWTPRTGWRFYNGSEILYQDGHAQQTPRFASNALGQRTLDLPQIEETPWSLVSYALKADFMGVPELLSYLKAHPKAAEEKLAPFRTHLWHRFALPWQALAVVLFAVPLGVAYSRRGAVGGIAGSIFIFFIFMFVNNLFLNLGKGGHLPPWLTVWLPHLLFGALGAVLFRYRAANRDLPKLRLWPRRKRRTQIARPRNRSGGNFDLKPPLAAS
jgi:LPS export ABC transporter permease LptG